MGSKVEVVTNLVRLWLGFDKWSKLVELRRAVEVLLLTVGTCSSSFDFNDVVAGLMDMKKGASVLHCLRSWCSHKGWSSCAELIAAVVSANQQAMSRRERLIVPSRVSPWLEEYLRKRLGHGSALRASAPDTYTSAVLASLSPKQEKMGTKAQTEKMLRGVSSKHEKPVKKALFQADFLKPEPLVMFLKRC